jgi:hypothetical protein
MPIGLHAGRQIYDAIADLALRVCSENMLAQDPSALTISVARAGVGKENSPTKRLCSKQRRRSKLPKKIKPLCGALLFDYGSFKATKSLINASMLAFTDPSLASFNRCEPIKASDIFAV